MTSIAEAIRGATAALERTGSDGPGLEAKWLLGRTLGCSTAWMYGHLDFVLDQAAARTFDESVARRELGEPLSYILGDCEFYGRTVAVDSRVLVPRPETELLVEVAIRFAARFRESGRPISRIVDVGTGSGVLAVTLALELPGSNVVATDISAGALAVAASNCRRYGVEGSVTLIRSDLFDHWQALPEADPVVSTGDLPFDLVVANLPYIASDDIDGLQPEVRREPRLALDGGVDGLDLYRRFFRRVGSYLSPRGGLFAEIGHAQGPAVARLATLAFPNRRVQVLPDLTGKARVVAVTP